MYFTFASDQNGSGAFYNINAEEYLSKKFSGELSGDKEYIYSNLRRTWD